MNHAGSSHVETHRGCAGTRAGGRWGRESTHTGPDRSHKCCLMEDRWLLWRWRGRESQSERQRTQSCEKCILLYVMSFQKAFIFSITPLITPLMLPGLTCGKGGGGGGLSVGGNSRCGGGGRRGHFCRNKHNTQLRSM